MVIRTNPRDNTEVYYRVDDRSVSPARRGGLPATPNSFRSSLKKDSSIKETTKASEEESEVLRNFMGSQFLEGDERYRKIIGHLVD